MGDIVEAVFAGIGFIGTAVIFVGCFIPVVEEDDKFKSPYFGEDYEPHLVKKSDRIID